ncbi:MAG: hypothetical protein FJ267_12775, partial [Planctomycetes bacterium]|nr:hypothetical protein [Planctomycetota bacterium]
MTLTIRNGRSIGQQAWQSRCRELAQWAWDRLAIKRDRHGLYSAEGGASWTFSELTTDDLAAHFAGEITLGVGSTSLEDKCLWVAWDLDNHVSDLTTNQNLAYAIVLRDSLRAMGFHPLIEDSDGKGGIHLWVLFKSPIPAKQAHAFSTSVANDFQEHGLDKIECLPKNSTVQHTDAKCGTYLRVPAKHHKREHWSRFYGDDDWLSHSDSVQLLLNYLGDDPALIPGIPELPKQRSTAGFAGSVDLTDRDEALAIDALRSVSPDDYDIWLKIGQALHSVGDQMLAHWIDWSRGSEKYKDGECEAKWKTFHRGGSISLGTLFYLAESSGWIRPPRKYVRRGADAGVTRDDHGVITEVKDELPTNAVELLLDEKTVNDTVVTLLAKRGDIFDHNGSLAVIVSEHVDGDGSRRIIQHLSLATLREMISETCRFFTWGQDKESGEEIPVWQRVPKWCYEAILARGSWKGLRPIRGIVTSPVLRS